MLRDQAFCQCNVFWRINARYGDGIRLHFDTLNAHAVFQKPQLLKTLQSFIVTLRQFHISPQRIQTVRIKTNMTTYGRHGASFP